MMGKTQYDIFEFSANFEQETCAHCLETLGTQEFVDLRK